MDRIQKIKRADIVLAALVLLAAFALFLFGRIRQWQNDGTCVIVTVDGNEYGRYVLAQDAVIRVRTRYGVNELTIADGKAQITDADCPGSDCMHMAPITAQGGTIVCLPHHLAVEVSSADSGIDVLVQ